MSSQGIPMKPSAPLKPAVPMHVPDAGSGLVVMSGILLVMAILWKKLGWKKQTQNS
jgi:hypothetical protein